MTSLTSQHQIDRDASRGMALMTGAMLIVPGLDATAKFLGETLSPFQIGFLRYLVQTLILLGIVALLRRRLFTPETWRAMPRFALCGVLIAVSVGSLFWALQYLPLANAIAIFFVEPLVLTAFSAIFLGEKVGWHRMSAVVVGLVGALIVIRPNFAMFGWAAMLPLLAAFTFAGVMTTLRAMPAAIDTVRIQTFCGGFAALVLGVAMIVGHFLQVKLFTFVPPTTNQWLILVALGVVATIAQAMFTLAARFAQASLLAPFQYLEIVMATVYGYFIFDEFPDALTWLGTTIILSAGLYVVHRERRLARARARLRQMPLG